MKINSPTQPFHIPESLSSNRINSLHPFNWIFVLAFFLLNWLTPSLHAQSSRPPWATHDLIGSCQDGVNEILDEEIRENRPDVVLRTNGDVLPQQLPNGDVDARIVGSKGKANGWIAKVDSGIIWLNWAQMKKVFPDCHIWSPETARDLLELILAHEIQHLVQVNPSLPFGVPGKPSSSDPENTPDSELHIKLYISDASRICGLVCSEIDDHEWWESCEFIDALCALHKFIQENVNIPGNEDISGPGIPDGLEKIPDCLCCVTFRQVTCVYRVSNVTVFDYGTVFIEADPETPSN